MGAVPSRETLQRGLYVVRPPPAGAVGGSKKQEIVLIPLTKEFFPSPDCALFVQFHKTRCDAGVNYYFRRPGNPGDLSRIPFTGSSDGNSSYPSREVLYRGVVDRVEEMLFDTDEEMRQAHERTAESGGSKKRVLPIICAVAFRYDPKKLAQQNSNTGSGVSQQLQVAMEQGVYLGGSIVNIVGCFGFVPMEAEGAQQMAAAGFGSMSAGSQSYGTAQSPSRLSMRDGSLLSSHPSKMLTPGSLFPTTAVPGRERHEDPFSVPTGQYSHPTVQPVLTSASSLASSPSYDPHKPISRRRSRVLVPGRAVAPTGGGGLIHSQGISGSNYDHFVSLPPPVAAPLAAIVFLTKSAGEQNLSRVTFMAASMYYNQLLDTGLLHRGTRETMHFPYCAKPSLPPMDTFSFSSLMTNIPILSFLHEIRCRLGLVGIGPHHTNSLHSSASSLNGSPSSHPGSPTGFTVANDFESWITEDNMLHGRVGKELAEHICLTLAESPEIFARRVDPLPSDDSYWRFRGLVDRNHPPPLPLSEGGSTHVDNLDVYVMGAAVMDGFDEGDVLRYDTDLRLWVADRTIPLDAVVLAAMRPHCKIAREAPPDDPGWVTTLQEVQEGDEDYDDADAEVEDTNSNDNDIKKNSVATAECGGGQKRYKRVHVGDGNFYIYRFELNGKTYYHGTVPDFANPNKKSSQGALLSSVPRREGAASAGRPAPLHPTAINAGEASQSPVGGRRGSGGTARDLPSITSALFSLTQDGGGDNEKHEGGMSYLPTRVTSTAIDTAMRWMGTLFHYATNTRQSSGGTGVDATKQTVLPRSPQLSSSLGMSTPVARRQATLVEVGPEAVQNAAIPQQREVAEKKGGFVKRFVHETRYVWDWRKS